MTSLVNCDHRAGHRLCFRRTPAVVVTVVTLLLALAVTHGVTAEDSMSHSTMTSVCLAIFGGFAAVGAAAIGGFRTSPRSGGAVLSRAAFNSIFRPATTCTPARAGPARLQVFMN